MTAKRCSSSPVSRRSGIRRSALMRWVKRAIERLRPALTTAADWLLDREIRRKGDWSVKRPYTEPSGWAFEFQNDWYPDIDDTAMVLLALPHMRGSNARAQSATRQRALDWLLAMQSKDGGWAAFDVDNNWEILTHVPFADHNAMLDPTCAGYHGPHAGSTRGEWLRPQPSGVPARDRLPDAHAAVGWQLVWPMGCCVYLRHLLRAARPAGDGRRRSRASCSARQ